MIIIRTIMMILNDHNKDNNCNDDHNKDNNDDT